MPSRLSHHRPGLIPIVAILLSLVTVGCGGESPDDFVPPEELCPTEYEVEGIAGRVLHEVGTGTYPNAWVTLIYEDRSRKPDTQEVMDTDSHDEDALFRFRDVPDGTHTLRACVGTVFSAEVEVRVADGMSSFQCVRVFSPGC